MVADRIGVAASRLLGAAAACVILLPFAARLRKSYWSGCMKAATVICQQIFAILALVIFLLKVFSKSHSKSFFFALASRSSFGAASDAVVRSSIVFRNAVPADRIVVAASRLLGAAAACVILLSCAAGSRKSSWSGCIKAAKVICQQIFSILALVIFRFKVLLKGVSKSKCFFFRFGVEIRFWSCNSCCDYVQESFSV